MKLIIANTNVHQDAEGRYSLNDLHKAAGGEDRHQPRYFLANQQTQDLITEISIATDGGIPLTVRKGGRSQGSYGVKELVYAYAMWISPKFHLQVIRAYDALVTDQAPKVLSSRNLKGAMEAHFMVIEAMKKIGVRNEMALAVGLQAIHEDTGLTMEGYRLALPSVEDVCNLNQTQLGEIVGLSSRAVGTRLREIGFMVDDESGNRVITQAGMVHGEMRPFNRSGHSGYEPRWRKSVIQHMHIHQELDDSPVL